MPSDGLNSHGKPKPSKVAVHHVHKLRIDGRYRRINTKSVVNALTRTGYVNRINVSRRPPSGILYAFPTFDKCDSLLYFPTSMTKYLNSGDMEALAKLYNAHIDKKCSFNLTTSYKSIKSAHQLLKSGSLDSVLQPDRIICVHNTKVVANRIVATMLAKYTDSAALYNAVVRSANANRAISLRGRDRAADIKLHIAESEILQDTVKEEYCAIADSGTDFEAYLKSVMTFTFDDTTKKIVSMSCSGYLSSMHAVEAVSRDLCEK